MLGVDITLLLAGKYDVVGTDITPSRTLAYRGRQFFRCDITNRKKTVDIIKKTKADIVIHAAAWTDVDGCQLDSETAMKVNCDGAHNVAVGCKESNATMMYISSDFVFDGSKKSPYTEDDHANPLNVYGLSKLKGEEALRRELDTYFIIRTSWLFGKNGKNFVDIILDKADRGEELRIVMDQFGSPTYTKDFAMALGRLIELSLKNKSLGGVFHFCNSGSCSWYRYAEEILSVSGKIDETRLSPITSAELDRPAPRPGMSILNTDKYEQTCKDKPRRWQDALRDYLLNDSRKSEYEYVQSFKG